MANNEDFIKKEPSKEKKEQISFTNQQREVFTLEDLASVDKDLKEVVSAFLRLHVFRPRESTVLKRLEMLFIVALRLVGYTTLFSIANRAPAVTKDVLKNRLDKAFLSLDKENEWAGRILSPTLVDTFADFLEEKRVQTSLNPTLGTTMNVRRKGTHSKQVFLRYHAFVSQQTKDRAAPDVESIHTTDYQSGDVSQQLDVAVGLTSAFGSVTGSFSSGTSSTSVTQLEGKTDFYVTRKITIENFPKPLATTYMHPEVVEYLGRVIVEGAKMTRLEEREKQLKILYAFFDEFGTHFCVENWFGASRIERLVSIASAKSSFSEGKFGIEGPDSAPVAPKFSLRKKREAKTVQKTEKQTLMVSGKLDDKGGVTSESLIYSRFIPIWKLFEMDDLSQRIQGKSQKKARKLLLDVIKEAWMLYMDENTYLVHIPSYVFIGEQAMPESVLRLAITKKNEIQFSGDAANVDTVLNRQFNGDGSFSIQKQIISNLYLPQDEQERDNVNAYLCVLKKKKAAPTARQHYMLGVTYAKGPNTKFVEEENGIIAVADPLIAIKHYLTVKIIKGRLGYTPSLTSKFEKAVTWRFDPLAREVGKKQNWYFTAVVQQQNIQNQPSESSKSQSKSSETSEKSA